MITLVKLDRRMNGHGHFTHRVDITGPYRDTSIVLYKARKWLWELFGPGCEYNILSRLVKHNITDVKWAWDTEHNNCRIYLKDQALTQFLLMKTKLETIDENL
jgi:hypothetical protein